MHIYPGSCHCGHVRFEMRKSVPISDLIDCNCSICRKKGIVHTPAENDELIVHSGGDDLAEYRFGSKTATYWFCPHCGVEPFHRSRANPHRYSVNARALDDFYAILARVGLRFIDCLEHPLDRGSNVYPAAPNPYKSVRGSSDER